ncbi:MAG: BON domain-containing protein [Terrimonas ferruginea]|uniref:BON domain-containing protein n=1 Tax=Terrimonas ferruginea TaxID=249 RepID=UPI000929F44F|nr:BON domain-containing protein [Terrimonas ferruginea]MBN8784061.1 BON domain-containing protein [Terrimonas ferruginea]OJW41638.1 MAG: ornithine aminotransferase [Sphingobacteriales bacterium 48-107]
MKSNAELQKDVQDAIKWEPMLNAAEIGVTVKDGVVTLTGVVDTYIKKTEAEDAAKNVAGVKAVVEKIEVKHNTQLGKKDDNEIAAEILNAFRWNWQIPNDKVRVKVEKGWVTLEGNLDWGYQRDAAKNAVKNLLGVVGVINDIKIKPTSEEVIEKAAIESALKRNWSIYDNDITVKVSGHKATLTGTVDSWYQKQEAGRIAYNAPGVWSVDNELTVDYDYALMDS